MEVDRYAAIGWIPDKNYVERHMDACREVYALLPDDEKEVMMKREYVIATAVMTGEVCYPARGMFGRLSKGKLCDRCHNGPCHGPLERYDELVK